MGFQNIAVAALCVCLAACGVPAARQSPVQAAGMGMPRPAAGATEYSIDPAQSELRLLVYRAGPMARLGHNHVILNRSIGGWVDAADRPESASFSIYMPAADFLVDDPRARSEEGPDFASEVPDDAKMGTRRNMLGDELLDAERFPVITLTSVGIARAPQGSLEATVAIGVAGHDSVIVVPFALQTSIDRLSAAGSVVLHQSDLGLTPFSIMLGALQVQDTITVKFKFVATAPHT